MKAIKEGGLKQFLEENDLNGYLMTFPELRPLLKSLVFTDIIRLHPANPETHTLVSPASPLSYLMTKNNGLEALQQKYALMAPHLRNSTDLTLETLAFATYSETKPNSDEPVDKHPILPLDHFALEAFIQAKK